MKSFPNYDGTYRLMRESKRKNMIDPRIAVLGEALTSARKKLGLTQAQVGRAMGIGQASVSRMEGGLTDYGIDKLLAYLQALGGGVVRIKVVQELCPEDQECTSSNFTVVPLRLGTSGLTVAYAEITKCEKNGCLEIAINQKNIGSHRKY